MEPPVDRLRRLLDRAFRDRRVVLAGGPVAGSTARVAGLRALGAERCLVLGVGRGTGPLPAAADADVVSVDLPPAADVPASIRAEEALFADPPGVYVDALDRFDPEGDAIVLAPPFSAVYELCGRAAYGARRPEWVALEDKMVADELLAAAAIPTPPFELVTAEPAALGAAAARLDRGAGTVWAGDAVLGFNGGTAYVRWVVDEEDVAEATAHLGSKCERVRVATFVEGIPCSIHGFVTDDGVAVFRPVELLTLRRARAPRLRFAGANTIWDPPDADRADMRAAAARLGKVLRERVGFRGAFTIDGILSSGGWVANECNPRFGAGLQYARAALPALALDLLHHVVIAGDGGGVCAADVEALVVEAGDRRRWGATWVPVARRWPESTSLPLCGDARGYRAAAGPDGADATLAYGPGPMGGFVRCEFVPDRMPIGASVAPRAAAALAFADAHCGAGIGPLTPPVPVRP
jgi:hypothetical protein